MYLDASMLKTFSSLPPPTLYVVGFQLAFSPGQRHRSSKIRHSAL